MGRTRTWEYGEVSEALAQTLKSNKQKRKASVIKILKFKIKYFKRSELRQKKQKNKNHP